MPAAAIRASWSTVDRIAQAITSKDEKEWALADIAAALAATDPERAERIAQAITSEYSKAVTLVKIAEACTQG